MDRVGARLRYIGCTRRSLTARPRTRCRNRLRYGHKRPAGSLRRANLLPWSGWPLPALPSVHSLNRAPAPAAAAAAAAAAGMHPSPGSPNRPGRSASPEAAAEAAGAEAAAAAAAEPGCRSCTPGSAAGCATGSDRSTRSPNVIRELELAGVEEAILQAEVDVRRDRLADAGENLPGNRAVAVADARANVPATSTLYSTLA